ncbi:MAG: S9 family peptidase [Candidatus Limnocylindrales bacterium]
MTTGAEGAKTAVAGTGPTVAPFGSWHSPISVELVSGAAVTITEPATDGESVFWLEGRPTEGGRRTLLRHGADGVTRELTPNPFRAGNRVHEYGGGSFLADGDLVIVSSQADGRLYRLDPEGVAAPSPITPAGPWRFADLRLDPRPPRLVAVRETHDAQRPDDPLLVVNEIVALALDGSDGAGRVLVTGLDFVAAPRFSRDGRWLAWLEWDMPAMPWDASRLRVAPVREDGTLGEARTLAGGEGISVAQPEWSPAGVLHVVSDETGWWNLYAFDGGLGEELSDASKRPVAPMPAEFADAAWVFDRSSYAFTPDGGILATPRADGRDRLIRIDPDGTVREVETPFTEFEGLRIAGETAVVAGSGPHDGNALLRLDPRSGEPAGVLARSLPSPVDPAVLPTAESITFPTSGGATARALFYRPANEHFRGPEGEKPPLLVLVHGGPTDSASSGLSLSRALYTSRGIAVVDVDYRGSTGYGREYRDGLKLGLGVVDVDDVTAAARFLAARGDVDPARMAVAGGSAGGYTTLACLAFRPDVFAAGISLFGIADLELIHEDSHKFESRYDEGHVGPWDGDHAVWRERSPIHALDRMRAPLLVMQGLEDRVVPPSQVDAMEAAFRAHGHPYVALRFEGEGHGFRRAETKRAQYRAEIGFLARVFGFTPADGIEPLEVPGLA